MMNITVGDFLDNLTDYGDHRFIIVDTVTNDGITDDPYNFGDNDLWDYIIDSVDLYRDNKICIYVYVPHNAMYKYISK